MGTPLQDSLLILDAIHEPYFRLNSNFSFTFVNRAAESLLGTSTASLLGKQPWELHNQITGTCFEEHVRRAMNGRISATFENYSEPGRRWYAVTATPDSGGGIVVHFSDITEKKITEEGYRLIAQNTGDVIWLWDVAEHRCLYITPSIQKLRGFSPEEIMAQPLDQAMLPDDYQMIVRQTRERVTAVQAGDETARTAANEVEYLCKDGSKVVVERVTTLLSDDHGKVRHILGVSRDITERKKMSEALRKSEEKFSKAFQSNPAAITIADLENASYLEVNDAFERLSGHRRAEIIGRKWIALGLWADPPNRDEAVKRLLEQGRLWNWEFRFRRKSGEVGTGLLSAQLIEIDGHRCAITATIDITETLELQNQLRQAQKLEGIGRLAGGVAHDFNNILTVITGYSGLLLQKIGHTDPLRHYASEIEKAAVSAAGLTQQLLAFSRKQVIAPKALDLNSIIEDAVRMLRRLIGEHIELVSSLDPLVGQVMAGADQLHQVIMNLVVNARDAMPDGGRVIIATSNVNLAESAVAGRPHAAAGRHVLMTVTDTGNGMTDDVLKSIFEPFFTTKERGKGTGLGLATVYGIVQQSGGFIDVTSEAGHGSSFKVYLPRIDDCETPQAAAPPATLRAPLRGGETVLVVEDLDPLRELTTSILKECGYDVLEAANGADGIAVAREHSHEIHLLLTDVIMPGINGKELYEALRKVRPALKALFMSGYPDDVIAHRGVLDSGVAFMPKPFNREVLLAKIREVLSGDAGLSVPSGEA